MNRINSYFLGKIRAYVLKRLEDELRPEYVFHSKDHTLDVFNNSIIIGMGSDFSGEEINCLKVSALFHDIGYIIGYQEHELASVTMAKEFLNSLNLSENEINQVERAVLSTKIPQKPVDRVSGALCDADLMHLTFDDYFERMEKLRLEWKLTGRSDLSEMEFHLNSIEFFQLHRYHTKYGREILEPKKNIILNRIRERCAEIIS